MGQGMIQSEAKSLVQLLTTALGSSDEEVSFLRVSEYPMSLTSSVSLLRPMVWEPHCLVAL